MYVRAKINTKTPDTKRENLVPTTQKREVLQSINSPIDHILYFQRTIGNQAVQRLFKSKDIQAKLRIGESNDIYEQEADRVADEVMRMPEQQVQQQPEEEKDAVLNDSEGTIQPKPLADQITPLVQRQVEPQEEEKEEEEEILQTKEISGQPHEVTPDLESRIQALKGGGQPLSKSERAFFEPRFGYDFSEVRVHTDVDAFRLARSVNARAFTVGRDIYFGVGRYSPNTSPGKKLLAHELTHVVQQNGTANTGVTHTGTFANHGSCVQRTVSNQMLTIRDNLTYGIFDWAITDAEAHEVLMILKNILNDTDLADTVAVMEQEGLVDRLFDNVSEDEQNREVETLERIHRMRVHIRTARHGETEVTMTAVGPCTPEQMHLIISKTEITKDWARRSKERVGNFTRNPAANAPVANLLDTHFFHQANAGNLTVPQQQSYPSVLSVN
jgi:hypothetical protein